MTDTPTREERLDAERRATLPMLYALVMRTGRERITRAEIEAATNPDLRLTWTVDEATNSIVVQVVTVHSLGGQAERAGQVVQ